MKINSDVKISESAIIPETAVIHEGDEIVSFFSRHV
jgi:hypothetical protein